MFLSYIIVVVLLCVIKSAKSFNLEPRIPLIKEGEPGSYFGFSVAQHQMDMDDGGPNQTLILVGAPLGQNLQPNTNRSGALWKCGITTRQSDCQQIITDGLPIDDPDVVSLEGPSKGQMKDGQWLGAVVRSTGEFVLVCANRYMDSYWGNGLCYALSKDLKVETYLEPCTGRPRNRAHEEFGYCQAGTSGLFLEDGTLIIGAPGPRTWRGTIFVSDLGGEYLSRDKTVYHGPIETNCSYIDNYSYLGMSVAAGNFFNNGTAFAAGGPRSNNTGQVIIFTRTPTVPTLNVGLILTGEQLASHFGYQMTTADVNGDGLPDLIVSAPFYFGKSQGGAVYVYTNSYEKCNLTCKPPMMLTGKEDSRFGFALTSLGDLNKDGFEDVAIGAPYEDYGVVYIYLGSKDGLLKKPSQRISAKDLPVIEFEFTQQSGYIKTLGYSLSGGMDMDNNGYPDLLIGAFEQDAVVLLRARPIIDIKTEIRPAENLINIDPNRLGCQADPDSNYTCFSFHACCKIMSLDKNTRSDHQYLSYTIEAETFAGNRKYSRVWFGKDSTRPHSINRKIKITATNKEFCDQHTVYIKENTRDILSPLKFRLNYTLQQPEPVYIRNGPLPIIDNYPILNQQEAEKVFNATFQKDCGDNDVCESNLSVDPSLDLSYEQTKYILTLGLEKEVKLKVQIANSGEPAYEAQLYIAHPKSLNYIASFDEERQVLCNPHNESMVVCGLGNPFKSNHEATVILRFDPKPISDSLSEFSFVVFANSTSVEVEKKEPKTIIVSILKNAEVSIKGSAVRTTIIYGGEVKDLSSIKYADDVGSNITHVYQVVNSGPWKVAQLNVEIAWPYQVASTTGEEKWLLYFENGPIVEGEGGGECYVPKYQINPLNLTLRTGIPDVPTNLRMPMYYPDFQQKYDSQHVKNRLRRDIVDTRPHEIIDHDGFKREVVTMDCNTKTAKCIYFNCTIYNLPRYETAVVKISARLWNSTLLKEYPRVDWVNIKSRAKIYIPSEYSIKQNTSDDEAVVDMLAYPDLINQKKSEPIPWWIIIVAIIIGIIVLILLTLILWKLGFFKRRRPDPTLSGNLEKNHREDSPFLNSR